MSKKEMLLWISLGSLGNFFIAGMETPKSMGLHTLRRIDNTLRLNCSISGLLESSRSSNAASFLNSLAILERAKNVRIQSKTPPPNHKPSIEEFLRDLDALEEAKKLRKQTLSQKQLKNSD